LEQKLKRDYLESLKAPAEPNKTKKKEGIMKNNYAGNTISTQQNLMSFETLKTEMIDY